MADTRASSSATVRHPRSLQQQCLPGAGPTPRLWALRTAIGLTALVAAAHLLSSAGVVSAYRRSDLKDVAQNEAVILWFLSTVTFASIPIALGWSLRVPAQAARLLQAYAGVLISGLAVVSLPVALIAYGPSGLITLPQFLVSSMIAALVFAGRTRR